MTSRIDDLPTEILFLIFKELRLKDISNCSNTCLRWLYCIEALFKNKGNKVQMDLNNKSLKMAKESSIMAKLSTAEHSEMD